MLQRFGYPTFVCGACKGRYDRANGLAYTATYLNGMVSPVCKNCNGK